MSYSSNHYLILFANCIPVKGAAVSVIYDLQRGAFEHIPNDLYDFILASKNRKIKELTELYGAENQESIDEYISFILENEFGFIDDSPNRFPPLTHDWDAHSVITNTIIEVNSNTRPHLPFIVSCLENLGCETVLLKLDKSIGFQEFKESLSAFSESIVANIQVFAYAQRNIHFEDYEEVVQNNKRINACYLEHPEPQLHQQDDSKLRLCQSITGRELKYHLFSVNNTHFAEAQHHHTYFNRKLYIGKLGEIKNAPECSEQFGLIHQLSATKDLTDIVLSSAFQKFWSIKKDQCEVCKDCPYRYMCVDDRLPKYTNQGFYQFEKECEFDPYQFEWSPIKQKVKEVKSPELA